MQLDEGKLPDWISGDHRPVRDRAAGPGVKAFEQPALLIDMAPTILAALGAPASIEHTGPGTVLYEVVGSDAVVGKRSDEPPRAKPAVQSPGMPTGDKASNVSDTEADEMEEHLRGLGYLE